MVGAFSNGRGAKTEMGSSGFDARLAQERRARLQAERLLAMRSEDLYAANRKLAEHAQLLSHQVIEQREENAALKGRTTQVAAELEDATDRAALAERRLWDALTAVEDGFAIFDSDCRLVAANPAYLAAFEGMTDLAPGASYDAVLRIAADEGIVDLEGAQPDDWVEDMLGRWEVEPIPQKDIRLWNGTYVRLIDKRTPQGDTVCLAVDITATVRRERELQEARDAALAASRAKSAFLANMSHEIRTPMNGVVSMAELLGETDLDADQKLYAETIRHSGEALLQIIKDILDYSRIEAGKLALKEERFDLLGLILEVFGLLRPGIEGRDIDFKLDLDLVCPDALVGDCGRLRQVLFNLVGNAVKFTEAGHVLVSVRGDAIDGTGRMRVTISVADTGIGIPPDKQDYVFGEFNQVEEEKNRGHDGAGLGLSITRKLMDLMGGSIRLDSEPGRGSTFICDVELGCASEPERVNPALHSDIPDIRLIGPIFSERAHAVIGTLAGLGARIRTQPQLDDTFEAGRGEAIVFSADTDTVSRWAEDVRRRGHEGPLLHICDDPEGAPPGLVPVLPSEGPDSVAERLIKQEVHDEAATDGQGSINARPQLAQPEKPVRLTLLAAEDNRTNRLVLQKMLRSFDLDLTLVGNGNELVEAYKATPPDLVLSDVSMPEMDGLEATRLIRDHEKEHGLRRVPIIALTAHVAEDDRDGILAAGMDGYLAKPVRKNALVEAIAAFAPEGKALAP